MAPYRTATLQEGCNIGNCIHNYRLSLGLLIVFRCEAARARREYKQDPTLEEDMYD